MSMNNWLTYPFGENEAMNLNMPADPQSVQYLDAEGNEHPTDVQARTF